LNDKASWHTNDIAEVEGASEQAAALALKRDVSLGERFSPLLRLRQMFAEYYINNPTHVILPQSPRASCLGIVSLGAHSRVAAAASCLCLSPGYDGAHMVHPLAWPTNLLDTLLRNNALVGGHP
jgi:hypothetical protein